MQKILASVLIFFISNVFSQPDITGKVLYFLQSPSIQGDPPELGIGYEDPTSINSAAAHKVLYGHYSAILENRHRQPNTGSSVTGKLPDNIQALRKSQLSKIVEIYRKNLFLTIQAAVNSTMGPKSFDFLSRLESCKDVFKQCDELGDLEISCGIRCLTNGYGLLNSLTDAMTSLVDRFCLPINTVFDSIFELNATLKHPILRKFLLFRKNFEQSKKSWLDISAHGAAALVPLIVEKVKTDMMPFRLFNEKLATVLQAEKLLQPFLDTVTMIANTLCVNVNDADIAADLLDVLYRNPVLIDAILGGLTALNLVSKYVPGQFQTPFAASAEAIRIMTGNVCGLIHYAESGNVPPCDQIGGFPVPGIPLPDIPDMPNLNPECLQGNAANGNEKDDAGEAEASDVSKDHDSNTPSNGRKKRELGYAKEMISATDIDGGSNDKSAFKGNGNGSGKKRKRRSLVVGQIKRWE